MKDSVQKGPREDDLLLEFRDYYLERRTIIHNLTARYLFLLHDGNACKTLTIEKGDNLNVC